MNQFFIIFISLLIGFLVFNKINENFDYTDYISPYKSDTDITENIYYNQLDYKPVNNINCCLVQTEYLPDPSNQFGGNFKYKYKKMANEECDLKKYRLDNNKQLFIDGYNGWTNDRCEDNLAKEKDKTFSLGSCRNINKECIDFVDKEYCDKYHMTWSIKTCRDPLEYKWIDKINFIKPESKNDGSYIMFNKKSQMASNIK